jgi:hypothetical protein
VTCFPFRIAGNTAAARVLKDQGRALVSAGDPNITNAANARRRWCTQGHYHNIGSAPSLGVTAVAGSLANWYSGNGAGVFIAIQAPISDGVNGPPLIGKTTHGPERAVNRYLYGGVYLAA